MLLFDVVVYAVFAGFESLRMSAHEEHGAMVRVFLRPSAPKRCGARCSAVNRGPAGPIQLDAPTFAHRLRD